jgi:hypothetical protein
MARNTLNPTQVAQYLGRKSAKRIANAHARSTLAQGPHSIWRMYSLLQRMKSLRHSFWYGVSERIQWSRGAFLETPARELCTVDLGQSERIAALRDRYQVQFELRMSAATSINNYEYLDILDRSGCPLRGRGLHRNSRTRRRHHRMISLLDAGFDKLVQRSRVTLSGTLVGTRDPKQASAAAPGALWWTRA